jgi:hypothetical protein
MLCRQRKMLEPNLPYSSNMTAFAKRHKIPVIVGIMEFQITMSEPVAHSEIAT